MRKLRIKKKITPPGKALDPIFSDAVVATPAPKAAQTEHASTTKSTTVETPKAKPATRVQVKKKVLPSFSISINKPTTKVSEPEADQKAAEAPKTGQAQMPLEQESLRKAWGALIDFIPDDQITLRQSLKANVPQITAPSECSFMVSNTFQAEKLQENMPTMLEFLQERVQNYALKIQVTISDKVESNLVFTANDKFKLMLEKNPALEELRKRLDLELD